MFRRVCDLVHWYLVGLVEPVDTRVAERALQLWRCETPTAGELGSNQHGVSGTQPTQVKRDAGAILARLKRDHPDLAQQVINGDISATKAAREAGIITPTVRLGKPGTVAAKLRDHYNVEDLAELAQQLRVILHHTSQTSRTRETSATEPKSVECDSCQSFTRKKQNNRTQK